MSSTTRTWSWKGLATRMLLVPVLTGACATAAFAQNRQPVTSQGATPQARTFADPKDQVKQARKALDAGQLDKAQDLANQAAAAKDYSWGLFDDTPDSVLKDVAAARAKADRVKADQMMKDGRGLYNKAARTPEERMANLEQAMSLAYKAQGLHGPYGMFDFGDKADTLLSDCAEAAKSKLSKSNPNLTVEGATAMAQANSGHTGHGRRRATPTGKTSDAPLTPAGNKTPTSTAMTPAKQQALALVVEARKLMAGPNPNLVVARAKVMEARKISDAGRCSYSATEDSPDLCYQHIQAEGKKQLDALIKDADAQMAKKDFAKAEASLKLAGTMTNSLGLYMVSVEEKRTALAKMSGGARVERQTVAANVPKAIPSPNIPAPNIPKTAMVAPVVMPVAGIVPPNGEMLIPAAPPAIPTPTAPSRTTVASSPVSGPSIPMIPAAPSTTVAVAPPGMVPVAPPTIVAVTPPMTTNTSAPTASMPIIPVTPAVQPIAEPVVSKASAGRMMLDQASKELMANDLEMAKKLAIQAQTTDPTCQAEAVKLLGMIEAEETTQNLRNAKTSFASAVQAYHAKQYEQALTLFKLIDPNHLSADDKAVYVTLTAASAAEVGKIKGVAQTAAQDPTLTPAKTQTDTVASQQNAMTDLEFQKLRSEGNKLLADAQTAFGRGETDLAMSMLQDFQARVRSSSLSASKQALLLRPIDSRLETFAQLKRTTDTAHPGGQAEAGRPGTDGGQEPGRGPEAGRNPEEGQGDQRASEAGQARRGREARGPDPPTRPGQSDARTGLQPRQDETASGRDQGGQRNQRRLLRQCDARGGAKWALRGY